jgi:hypothetical protein
MIFVLILASQMFLQNRQDLNQKPTGWDLKVMEDCAKWANERHKERGGGGHPNFGALWLKDIEKCQKKLGFMAKDRREI